MELNFKTGKQSKQVKPMNKVTIAVPEDVILKQQFKGEVEKDEIKFPTVLGEEHPFDPKITEGIYKKYGLVTGIVDKYVDFIVGPGFFVKGDTKRSEAIINQFMQDVSFDTLLRAWIKEALVKQSGFLELGGKKTETVKGMKILDAKYMYVIRDKKGKVTKYSQFKGAFDNFSKEKVITFEPFQVAQISFNQLGDDAYGMGIVYPALNNINSLMGLEVNMDILMKRKANAPIHAKLGDAEMPPTDDDVTNFGSKLEWLNNKHEWATPYNVEIKAIDFGKLGEKFDFPIQHNLDMIFAGVQIPKILIGEDVNQAVAPVQMDAFERRIQSIQSETEKVIEQQIFKRVLLSNGIQEHVEFEWGQPSNTEKNERIKQITELLKIIGLSPELSAQLQMELADLMNLDVKEVKPEDIEKAEVDETEQPRVPGQNNQPKQQKLNMELDMDEIDKSKRTIYEQQAQELDTDPFKPEATLREWLDFDFTLYLASILQAVDKEEFTLLAAKSRKEINQGKFSKAQIKSLKSVLKDGFKEGKRIVDIQQDLVDKVKIKDLVNSDGKILAKASNRTLLVARTETTKLSAIGAQNHFQAGGVEKYQWVSTLGPRTSDICQRLHGKIFTVGKGPLPPAHINCRSSIIPVEE